MHCDARSVSPTSRCGTILEAIRAGGEPVGEVTSGTMSPSLGIGIGMAYVPAELAAPGTELEIDVRGTRRAARVEEKPLYKKERD